jgi:uncharacterized membrane protein YhdT
MMPFLLREVSNIKLPLIIIVITRVIIGFVSLDSSFTVCEFGEDAN